MGFFKPAWMSDDWRKKEKALLAVETETNDAALLEIANNAPMLDVRTAAVKRLKAPSILERLIRNSNCEFVRLEAAIKIPDLSTLAEMAKNSDSNYICMAAVEHIAESHILTDLAKTANSLHVRRYAIIKLVGAKTTRSTEWDGGMGSDKSDAEYDKDLETDAVERTIDQFFLAFFATHSRFEYVQRSAIAKLTDLSTLKDVEINAENDAVRSWVQRRIKEL